MNARIRKSSALRTPSAIPMAVLVAVCTAIAEDEFSMSEDELFSDTSSLVATESLVDSSKQNAGIDEVKSVGFSGEVTAVGYGSASRQWLGEGQHRADAALGASVVANLMLDVRLPRGVKAFANAEVSAGAADSSGVMSASLNLRELFVDANIAHRVYLRAGKQVLQWGRCFFWNPTDLINVERRSFIEKIGYREGTLGLKAHAPFGTRVNLYGFADLRQAPAIDSVAGALKAEVLIGGVEVAMSAWGKRGHEPVIGLDASFPLFGAIGTLEASVSDGANYPTVAVDDSGWLEVRSRTGRWYPRVSFGFLAILDLLGVDDRLNLGAEFYYNGAAHSSTLITDTRRFPLPPASPGGASAPRLTKGEFFFANGLYEENSNAMWYAAVFTSVGDFIANDLTLDLNAIVNVNDWSAVATAGLSYTTLHDLSFGLSLNGFMGKDRAEYTIRGDGLMGRAFVGLKF